MEGYKVGGWTWNTGLWVGIEQTTIVLGLQLQYNGRPVCLLSVVSTCLPCLAWISHIRQNCFIWVEPRSCSETLLLKCIECIAHVNCTQVEELLLWAPSKTCQVWSGSDEQRDMRVHTLYYDCCQHQHRSPPHHAICHLSCATKEGGDRPRSNLLKQLKLSYFNTSTSSHFWLATRFPFVRSSRNLYSIVPWISNDIYTALYQIYMSEICTSQPLIHEDLNDT